MTDLTRDQIRLAGRLMKIGKLVNEPGMDDIAVKLNSGLTHREERHAEAWARAFELARTRGDEDAFKLAYVLMLELMEA